MSNITFNFSDVQAGSSAKPSIKPGIHENVTLGSITSETTPNGKAVIRVPFSLDNGAELNIDMSMEGNAPQYTMRKLKHMMTKVVDENVVNSATTLQDINKILSGKKLRMKFTGEEYVSQRDGKVYVKTVLGLPNFAEPMTITSEMSALTYNPNIEYDLKRVNKATVEANGAKVTDQIDSLPF
jgi:hypothetical protein